MAKLLLRDLMAARCRLTAGLSPWRKWIGLTTTPTGVEPIEAPGDTDLSFAFGAGVMAQRLTLAIAEKLDLALAEPRAGRPLGDRHMAAQTRAMKETRAE